MSSQRVSHSNRRRAIFALALPIIASMSSQNVLNLVDVAMLGQLGKEEVAGVGLCGMLLWMITSLLQGFSPAVQAITARRLGERNQDSLNESMVNAIYIIMLLGIPLTIGLVALAPTLFELLSDDPAVRLVGVDYLTIRLYTIVVIGFNFAFRGYFHGLKKSKLYMRTLISMHVINVLLNYILIFGKWGIPAMEARGAALGTAIATSLGCLTYLILMFRLRVGRLSFLPQVLTRSVMGKVLRLGLPSCLQHFTMATGFLLFFRISATISTTALAATNVLININLACVLIAIGLGMATITLVGNALGERRPDEAVAWVNSTAQIALVLLGMLGLLLALFPQFWLNLIIADQEVIATATLPLVLLGLFQFYDGAGVVFSYAHLGAGASRTVMVIAITHQWLFFLPACFIWVNFFEGQLLHLWICMAVYRLLLCCTYLVSIRRGKWLQIAL